MTYNNDDTPATRYEAARPLITDIIRRTARQHRLLSDDADEFHSYAWERMLAADPLRLFQERCSLGTFLTVVIRNYFKDFRNQRWGKWRHSRAARRLGELAMRLEALVARDGHSFDQALEIIRTNDRTPITRDELEALLGRLPVRSRTRFVSDALLAEIPAPEKDFDAPVERESRLTRARQLRQALSTVLATLEAHDRLVLKLLFEDGFTVAEAAAAMHISQKPLYRKRDQLLASIRERLQLAGVSKDDVDALADTLRADNDGELQHASTEGGGA